MIDCLYVEDLSEHALAASLERLPAAGQLLALVADADSARVSTLQAQCAARQLPLCGAVFPQLLLDDRLVSRGAVLLVLRGIPAPLLFERMAADGAAESSSHTLAAYVEDHLGEQQEGALFCIFDALVPNIGTHLDAWYLNLADRVRYFGVNGGNERFEPAPCLFDGTRFIAGGMLALLLPDHPGAVLDHGYPQPPHFIAATSAQGNRIVQIDWRPALEVYRETMASQYGVEVTRDNFYQHAVHFPFGIVRADGQLLVRIPVALDADGAIFCVGEIPPNALLTLLDARSVAPDTPQTLIRALQAGGERTADADLLMFYCAGRRMQKGESAACAELTALLQAAEARHLYGALSLGEIGGARAGGYPLFHNATLVGVPCLRT